MKCTICCIAKNENLYIKDFCDYHLNLGFDEIHIYDNNDINDMSLHNLNLDNRVIIHKFNGITGTPQNKAYTDFKSNVNFDWCAFIDIDEFITLNNFSNIKDFINSFDKNVEAIRLCWKVIGDDDIIVPNNKEIPIYDRLFKESKHYRKSSFKTLIKNIPFNITSVHYFVKPIVDNKIELPNTVYSDGTPANTIDIWHDGFISGKGYLRHYITKTLSEFIEQKLNRTKGNSPGQTKMNYYWRANFITKNKIDYLKSQNIDPGIKLYNIISEDCSAAFIYRFKNMEALNPFMWNLIDFNNMFNLIKNYDSINFQNIKLIQENIYSVKNSYGLNIDNKFKIFYIHYKKDENYDIPSYKTSSEKEVDVFYKYIENYILEKYKTRLNRMKNIEPIFLINDRIDYTVENLKKLINCQSKYKIILNLQYKKYKELINYVKSYKHVQLINAKSTRPAGCAESLINDIFK